MSIHDQLEIAMKDPEQAMKVVKTLVDAGVFKSYSQEDDDWEVEKNFFINEHTLADTFCGDDEINFSNINDFNIFEKKEECTTWALKINALHKLRLIANHLNGDWKPDWKDHKQAKYRIYASSSEGFSSYTNNHSVETMIYFKDENSVYKAIRLMGKESLDDLFL